MDNRNVRPEDMERITTPELAKAFIEDQIAYIKEQVGDKKVLLALSGGVDSSVVAAMLIKAIGDQLVCVHVNHGLLRKGEPEQVIKVFREELGANLIYVDAVDRFLDKLAGVTDPEEKRHIIGSEFIEVFAEEARKLDGIEFLAQGTIWPDILESEAGIKAHHNAGGLPEDLSVSSEKSWDSLTIWSTVSRSRVRALACAAPEPSRATVWKQSVNPTRSSVKSSQRTGWKERSGSILLSFPISNRPASRMGSGPSTGPASSARSIRPTLWK